MVKAKIFATAMLVVFYCCGCNIVNPVEKVPYYIKVDSTILSGNNYARYGSTKGHKITDIWVYANNNPVGAYEIPAYIPIIADSNDVISFRAGIWENGISSTRKAYELLNFSTKAINWPKETVKTIVPNFTYLDGVNMLFNWDFESSLQFEPATPGFDLPLSYTFGSGETYEGVSSAKLKHDTSHRVNQLIAQSSFEMSLNKAYYLEAHYKCTIPFEIFVVATNAQGQQKTHLVGGVNPKSTWNKIYFNLGNLHSSVQAKNYVLKIRSEIPKDKTSGEFYIDNLKLLTLN